MNNQASNMLRNAILVVAHPDDEILWFSSVADKVDEIVFCFNDYPALPALGSGRKQSLANYPLPHVSTLEIEESGSFSGADWKNPVATPYGVEIVNGKEIRQRYQDNFFILKEKLSEKLRPYTNVFTHNPWGEYGHEDHVQVYRVVETLQKRLPFRIWCSNYASNRSVSLMFDYFSGFDTSYLRLPTNLELASTLKALYQKNNCWTWYRDYRWFDEECFLESTHFVTDTKIAQGQRFPVNMLKTDFPDKPQIPPGKLFPFRKKVLHWMKRKLS